MCGCHQVYHEKFCEPEGEAEAFGSTRPDPPMGKCEEVGYHIGPFEEYEDPINGKWLLCLECIEEADVPPAAA